MHLYISPYRKWIRGVFLIGWPLITLATCFSPSALAFEKNPEPVEAYEDQDTDPSSPSKKEDKSTFGAEAGAQAKKYVNKGHETVSSTILFLSNSIDSFFGTTRGDEESNKSRLRVFYDARFQQDQKWDGKPDLRLSLRLPNLEKLFKFDYKKQGGPAVKDEKSAEEKKAAAATSEKEEPKKEEEAERLFFQTRKWTFNVNTGINVSLPPTANAQARLRRTMLIGDWEFNPTQEANYFTDLGFGLRFTHDLDYALGQGLLFRIANDVIWQKDTEDITTSHGPILFHQISDRRAVSYSFQATGIDRPQFYITNYIGAINYRQLLHENWLFAQISPSVSFPRGQNWESVYALFVRIEAVFGGI